MIPHPRKKIRRSHGFTLIITISLLVLLTLVGIGILSLSAVTLRTGAQSNAQRIARDNARMALMIALGQLQKHTGNDQRVTATADIAGDVGGISLIAGKAPVNNTSINSIAKGLTPVQNGSRFWTGVFSNRDTSAQIFTRTPSPTLVQWLVSGNESTPPAAFPPVAPAIANLPSSNLIALNASGTVSDPTSAVVLAGQNTVGTPDANTLGNYVVAPLVKISTDATKETTGRYAWWVGDEGVKARINLPVTPTPPDLQPVAHRGAWEVNTGMSNYPIPSSTNHSDLERITTIGSTPLIDSSIKLANGSGSALFHTATTDSFGVLCDTDRGGLRIDMTACLERGFPATGASTFPNVAAANRNILHSQLDRRLSSLKGPNWQVLRDFYNVARQANDQGKLICKAASGSASSGGITIAPIILDFRVVLGARLVRVSGNNCKLNPCAKVAIALANPYPYPLEWNQDLELEIIDETPTTNGTGTRIYAPGATSSRFLGRKGSGGFEPATLNSALFIIPKGSLPPGEARSYIQSGSVRRPINDSSTVRVPMALINAGSPSNFEICVEMDTPDSNQLDFTNFRQLDVREGWTTSQPSVELRLSGGSSSSGNILRRIERFEWDNAFHAATKLQIRHDGVASSLGVQVKMPFPLKIYNSQVSMPGMRYDLAGLPAASLMGTRGSTLRTFTDFNLRAVRFPKLITSYNPPPYFFDQTDNAITDIPPTPTTSSLPSQTGQAFTQNLAFNPLPWGHSLQNSETTRTMLFSFPKQFVSLAQLQHVDLTGDDTGASVSQQPGNAVGNSYASPFVKRDQVIQSRKNYIISGINTNNIDQSSTATATNYYDMSYLLNAALWDTYFFSSLSGSSSSGGSSSVPLNPAITVVQTPNDPALLNDPIQASTHLLVRGSFNVNCTSKDAWKALFASTRFAAHPAGGDPSGAMFPRSMEQKAPSALQVTGKGPDSFSGYRRLTPLQIDALAEQMVLQVRQRGPFVSLSHFVNRSLARLDSRTNYTALSRAGALQSAIDLSGINISPDGKKTSFDNKFNVDRDRLSLLADGDKPKADVLYPDPPNPPNQSNGTRGSTYGGTEDDGSEVWAPLSADLNFGSIASIYADRKLITDPVLKQEQGFRSTGIPGWLTQADMLQVIGPVISARSDTFRIRAYGEATSANGSEVLARAWCEAIVQRTTNYVDPTNTPQQRDISPTSGPLSPLNRRFGRRYEIVSFRWLGANEI